MEIGLPVPGSEVFRVAYWIRRHALGEGICTRASRAALDHVFHRGLFEHVDLYIDPANAPSIAVACDPESVPDEITYDVRLIPRWVTTIIDPTTGIRYVPTSTPSEESPTGFVPDIDGCEDPPDPTGGRPCGSGGGTRVRPDSHHQGVAD